MKWHGREIKIAVASGLSNAKEIMEEIKAGTADFDFVEVMACPGGCIMGGGQPIKSAKTRNVVDVFKKRSSSLYKIDEKSKVRKSHENPYLKEAYKEFFNEAGSKEAHSLLHTHYTKRKKYEI